MIKPTALVNGDVKMESGTAAPTVLIDGGDRPPSASSPVSAGGDSGVDSADGSTNDARRSSPAIAATANAELLLIQDSGFNVRIVPPAPAESFELQVSSMEMVQEIHQVLMDREETCHRTCFSLHLDGKPLDNFSELKNVENLREGSVLKIVEDPYTIRESRIHLRHVRDLIKSVDSLDTYNAVDCTSVSYLNSITNGCPSEKRKTKLDTNNTESLPPEHCLGSAGKDLPLSFLLPPKESSPSGSNQCLKILSSSGWNPPPGNRKLHGDLIYLYVLTMEDKRYHITSCTRGFYVNESTEEEFNPKPAFPKFFYHSLVDLLSQLSAHFRKNFPIFQKKRCQKHPFERVATPYQVFSWLAPNFDHSSDAIRAEDTFAFKLGYEEHIPGQTREWNEELQTTRELPRKTLPERLLRERAIFKVHSDFVAAATRGAMAVIDGNVMAINPGDEPKMQMYIWNNIFFSLGYDVKDHYKEFGGDAAAFVAPNNDLQGVKSYFNLDPDGLYVLGTVVIDYRGHRLTAQSIIPGILERDQEQSVVYGSIDFGKTVVASEKYKELLKNPAHKLNLLPHKVKSTNGDVVTLHSSVESKGIIGNDSRHYVLDLLRTFPPDVHYLADGEVSEVSKAAGYPRNHPHKLSCLRQELIDAFVESRHVSFFKIAAAELRQLKSKEEAANFKKTANDVIEVNGDVHKNETENNDANQIVDTLKNFNVSESDADVNSEDSTKEVIRKAAVAVGSLSDTEFDIRFNPDCFSPLVVMAEDDESLQKQKQLIIDAAEFVISTQIPNYINDCSTDHSFLPIDGASLSEAMHNRGINIRYLGKVAASIGDSPNLEHFKTVCCSELLCRSTKHLFRTFVANLDRRCVASTAIAHFLNCLLCPATNAVQQVSLVSEGAQLRPAVKNGSSGGGKGRKKKTANGSAVIDASGCVDWTLMTPKSLWTEICREMDVYYGYVVENESADNFLESHGVSKISILRRLCCITGVQILCGDYTFDTRQKLAFNEEDILNMYPVVKHVHPRASDAYIFYTTGQQKIQQCQLRAGYELVLEALNSLNNVYGPVHAELAQCMRLFARLAYILGDHQEALSQQHKAVLISERCNGLDHAQTILEYTNLALYCFANLQVSTALKLLYRARYLLLLANGETHPHMALLDSNIGLVLHAISEYDQSLKFLENALKLSIRYFGERSMKTASAYHLLARTQSCRGDFRSALQHEKETFAIYKNILGEEHDKTKESGECLKHLTQQAVTFQKHMNDITRNCGSVSQLLPLQIQQPSFASVLEMMNGINGIVFIQISPKDVEAMRVELEKSNGLVEENLDDKQDHMLDLD